MSYKQLTREQRYQIYVLKKAGHNQSQIAEHLGCHKSTISRELKRNAGNKGYRPKQASELALSRRKLGHRERITQASWEYIELLLQQQWSPEQVHGQLRKEKRPPVSTEWIYQHVYDDKRRGGTFISPFA